MVNKFIKGGIYNDKIKIIKKEKIVTFLMVIGIGIGISFLPGFSSKSIYASEIEVKQDAIDESTISTGYYALENGSLNKKASIQMSESSLYSIIKPKYTPFCYYSSDR